MFPPVAAVTRRRLLIGVTAIPLALTASACTEDPPVELPVDPDRAALLSALETELALRRVITSWTPSRADDQGAALLVVDSHVAALSGALGGAAETAESPSESSSASPSTSSSTASTPSTAEVRSAVDAAADAHSRALRDIGQRVTPLVAAVAASDAALGASLRGQRP